MPQPNQLKRNTDCNYVCRGRTERFITSPTSRIVNVTNFQYFQIIHTSNQCGNLCNCNRNLLSGIHASPNNSSFPQEPIDWWQSGLRSHENPPCKCSCSGTFICAFQIPNVLRPCSFNRWLVGTGHWSYDQSPNSKINHNVNKHVSPQCANGRVSRSTLRHQQQSHVTNTTVRKLSFQTCLSLRGQRTNNHGKGSKQCLCLCTSKRCTEQCLPMMGPEPKNCNFWLNCDPLRYTRPPASVHIGNPKMQWCCCLFPLKAHCYQPNSQLQKQRRLSCCAKHHVFNASDRGFSGLPVDKANSLQQNRTPKCTQLKVFHCCFNRKRTVIVLTAQYYQRKTLLFLSQIHRHLVCCKNQLILPHQSLHSLICIFCMPNTCSFLPSQRYCLYCSCCQKQNCTQLQAIPILLKTTSQKNALQRTVKTLHRQLQTPHNCPLTLCRGSMIGTCGGVQVLFFLNCKTHALFSQQTRNVCTLNIQICYSYNFCYRSYQSTSTIPQLNNKPKLQKKFGSHNNKIQNHMEKVGIKPTPVLQKSNVLSLNYFPI